MNMDDFSKKGPKEPNFKALKEHVQAVYKEEIWHEPQKEKGLLVLEEIILTSLIKIKLLG